MAYTLPHVTVCSVEDAFTNYFAAVELVDPLVVEAMRRVLLGRQDRAVTAVVEENYIDVDYSSSYYLQHVRSFTPVERNTTRIHFFSEAAEAIERLLRDPDEQETRDLLAKRAYLGYSVIRPGTTPTLGRTFISPPRTMLVRKEEQPAFFPTGTKIQADLCGVPLEAEVCPYLSQDKLVMACATASLWMSSRALSPKILGTREFTTSDITSLAMSLDRPYTPTVGGRGLRIDEIERAMMAMGYDADLRQFPDPSSLERACHLYVESGIPPILTLFIPPSTRHAVTVVGHTMAKRSPRRITSKLALCSARRTDPIMTSDGNGIYASTEFVPSLILHDDQRGMYLNASIRPPRLREEATLREHNVRSSAVVEVDYDGPNRVSYCTSFLAPQPSRVMLTHNDVIAHASNWLLKLMGQSDVQDRDLVMRAFLIRSNVYKEAIIRAHGQASGSSRMPPVLGAIYRDLPMPRYLWVAEFGYMDEWEQQEAPDLRIHGEMIYDATCVDLLSSLLVVHTTGKIAINEGTYGSIPYDLERDDQGRYILPDDIGYTTFAPHSVRP